MRRLDNYQGYTFGYSRCNSHRAQTPKGSAGKVTGRVGGIGTFTTALTVLGLVWFNGPVSAEAVVGVSSSAPMTASETGVTPVLHPIMDWTPTPQAGLSRPAADSDRSLTLVQFRALHAFPEDQQVLFACIARAESGFDETASIIDIDGLPRAGAWMVGETWWGTVPDDLMGQAEQAAEIASEHGSRPWTTREECE